MVSMVRNYIHVVSYTELKKRVASLKEMFAIARPKNNIKLDS